MEDPVQTSSRPGSHLFDEEVYQQEVATIVEEPVALVIADANDTVWRTEETKETIASPKSLPTVSSPVRTFEFHSQGNFEHGPTGRCKARMSEKGTYTYAVTKGNYPNAVNVAMQARGNWKQLSEDVGLEQADFFWRCNNLGIVGYDNIDNRLAMSTRPFVFNHFEVIKGIC